ncbi:MAG TPA: type II toxin-antitoxin system VapC family toxin [Planctomycetota bacterium]|nr:type II toxin-antitoxin system VapC family toxin [Planctomycetota bacterium]
MAAVVADTHALLWYVFSSPKLSAPALRAMEEALSSGDGIYVCAITLVELTYLVEKGKQPADALQRIERALEDETQGFTEVPVDLRISRALSRVPRTSVPDMPDRIIGATALHLGLQLVSRDQALRRSHIPVIW